MTKLAAAILHVDPARVRGALTEEAPMFPLKDATVLHLGVPIGAEPAELAARLRALAGGALEEHDDPRGVPIYPSDYELAADRWDAAVEELGEAADWVPLRTQEETMGDVLAALGVGAEEIAQMESAMAGGRGALFDQAMRMAREMAESGALEEMARKMGALAPPGAQGGLDLDALAKEAQRMLAEHPELEEQIRQAIDGARGDEDE